MIQAEVNGYEIVEMLKSYNEGMKSVKLCY